MPRLIPLGLAVALFGFVFIGLVNEETRARAASFAPNPIASTLAVNLFYDGAFENISFSEPRLDSQGRLVVAGSTFGGGASFPFRLYSISPNGTLNWQYPSGDEFLFTNYSFLAIGPQDRVYAITGLAKLFAVDSTGQAVPGWPVNVAPSDSFNPGIFYGDPISVDLGTGVVFAGGGGTRSFDDFPTAITALNPDGTVKWSNRDFGNGSNCQFVRGPQGRIYVDVGFTHLATLDQNSGSTICEENPVPGPWGGGFVGNSDGVFRSFFSSIFAFGGSCNSQQIFDSSNGWLFLNNYAEGRVFGYDIDPNAGDPRLFAVSSNGTFLWRNPTIRANSIKAIKNNVLYILGQDTTDGNKPKLFLLSAQTGEVLDSLETTPYCSSCGAAVADSGLIYLSDLGSTRIYKVTGGPGPTPTPNQPPIAGFTMSVGSNSATEGQTLNITAPTGPVFVNFAADRSSDSDGSVGVWDWKIDGNTVSNASSFAYGLNTGIHSVALTVTDNQGANSTQAIGQINIALPNPCPGLPDPSVADGLTKLVPDENDTSNIGSRTPVILIHGIHGNEANGSDNIAQLNRAYFAGLLNNFYNKKFQSKYKVYRFHYVSDKHPVNEIARALRNDLDSRICVEPGFDKPLVIIAHSMGGLVGRSYMNYYPHYAGLYAGQEGGIRVTKLITLATPHHGSPGASGQSRIDLATNSDWLVTLGISSWVYWDLIQGTIRDRLPADMPNRSDLTWDNFDGSVNSTNIDINTALVVLNAQERFASRIAAYTGYIKLDEPDRRKFLKNNFVTDDSSGIIVTAAAPAALIKDNHYKLLMANVVMDYGMAHRFAFNDGMVPIESANFSRNFEVSAHVTCPRYDHLDMKDGDPTKKCNNSLTLFQSINKDLGLR
jgi:pimeloyl-ACP methyl ester carboxylesterase